MATLIKNLQSATYTPDVSVNPNQQQLQQTLEQNLVARETTRFYEEYFKTQQQVQLNAFAATVAKKMYSTSCEQTAAAAAEIQTTCTAFHSQALALKVTANVLTQVRMALDEQIAQQVEECGGSASCVLEKHISRVDSELVIAQTKRDDVQAWLTTLQTLRTNVERASTSAVATNGSSGFGARVTTAETMRSTTAASTTVAEETETDTRTTAAADAFGEEAPSTRGSRRHR